LTTLARASVPLALAVLLAAATPAPAAPLGGSRVDRVVLENGLTVLLLPEPGTGLISVGMMYTVGAKNEAAGTTGLAHYAEHMNFRATARFPGHEITEAITRRGGRWTGYTWIDQTFFQTTLGKEHLGLALDIEADRMGGALYDEKDFASERTSVVAELRSYDDPHSLLYDEVLGAALLVHPYRNNTIGWLTDVEAVTRDAAYAFYRRFYTPRNAVLVVGGDFDPRDALARIEADFSARAPGDALTHVATVEPPQSGERRVTVRKPGPRAEVLIAFPSPSLADPDFPAMVLFDALFAGGKGLWFLRSYPERPDAPLERAVVASGAAREVKTAFQASLYPYVYTLSATTPSGDGLAAAEKALFGAVETASSLELTGADEEGVGRPARNTCESGIDLLAARRVPNNKEESIGARRHRPQADRFALERELHDPFRRVGLQIP
jgi:zinc protease